MKSIEKLRKYKLFDEGERLSAYLPSDELAEEIQAEIDANYMRLPLDADGEPIHVGDDLRSASSKTKYTALGFWFDFDCGIWLVMVSSKQAMSGNMLRHVKPRTLEDILNDRINDVLGVMTSGIGIALETALNDSFGEECADEIRELLGSDVE